MATQSIVGTRPQSLFIDRHDHIYLSDHTHRRILVWTPRNDDPQSSFNISLRDSSNIFVGMNGEVFFEHGGETGRIDKWSIGRNESVLVAKFDDHCFGLFIDLNNSLYCSLSEKHQVKKISLDSDGDREMILMAGTGSAGPGLDQLGRPRGIFVDSDFGLFVADGCNHRIQRFDPGQIDGTTVAGQGIPNGLYLRIPTNVMVDRKGHLYISDNLNHRIIRSNGAVWQCIAGPTGVGGPNPNQLSANHVVQWDSQKRLYVADEGNNRIQRFDLIDDGCPVDVSEGKMCIREEISS